MIRVVMLGRTGNNLFQYAVARVLSLRHGVPILMDGGGFRGSDWREVRQIGRLGLHANIRRGPTLLVRAMRRFPGRHPWEYLGLPVVKDRPDWSGFDPAQLESPGDVVLMGYFQSPRYFESIAGQLREELRMDELNWRAPTRAMADRLRQGETVAVHVRRTDYVNRPVFDVCGPAYYRRAMNRLRREKEGLRFHVFSDDPAWCRQHFTEDDVEMLPLSEAAGDPLHDLFLMSCARHQIIANSSYSWWSAWLAERSGQRVLAPDRWFGGGIDAPIEDKLLPHWEQVLTENLETLE